MDGLFTNVPQNCNLETLQNFPEKSRNEVLPRNKYMLKISNIKTGKWCEICSKLTIKTTEWRRWSFLQNYVTALTH